MCTKRVDILQGELSSKMKVLRETVRGKTAVHTAQVFVSAGFMLYLCIFESICLAIYVENAKFML